MPATLTATHTDLVPTAGTRVADAPITRSRFSDQLSSESTTDHNAAARALMLLESLGREGRAMTANGLARRCGVPRSTTYVLLRILESRGFVRHDAARHTWSLGAAITHLASAAQDVTAFASQTLPVLTKLSSDLGRDVALVALRGDETCYHQVVRGSAAPLLPARNTRLPSTECAGGRAILCHLPAEQLEALFPAWRPLSRFGGRGPTTRRELVEMLERDRRRDFTIREGSGHACEIGVAVPGHRVAVVVGQPGRPSERVLRSSFEAARRAAQSVAELIAV
jgi:DNA-binding IclR family transcriptional regulator